MMTFLTGMGVGLLFGAAGIIGLAFWLNWRRSSASGAQTVTDGQRLREARRYLTIIRQSPSNSFAIRVAKKALAATDGGAADA